MTRPIPVRDLTVGDEFRLWRGDNAKVHTLMAVGDHPINPTLLLETPSQKMEARPSMEVWVEEPDGA